MARKKTKQEQIEGVEEENEVVYAPGNLPDFDADHPREDDFTVISTISDQDWLAQGNIKSTSVITGHVHEPKVKQATNFNRLLSVRDGFKNRKAWEIDTALETLERFGAIRPDAEILGVGAGTERTIFELSNHVRRVFATDLYAGAGTWSQTAPPDMLMGKFKKVAGGSFNPRRIVAQHMDMRDLQYEDNSFDGIFSSGSIEHIGTWNDIAKAAREIGRVLKPGGVASISTEFMISGNGDGWGGVLLFTPERIQEYIVEPSGLDLVDEPTWAQPVDDETMATAHKLYDIVVHKKLPPVEGVLLEHGFAFTSVHIALIKGAG
jgi:ubiquinone/menaquinone biosynthesis C-methylase UbiE